MQAFQDPFQGMFPSFGGFGGLGALMNMPSPGAGSASYSYSSFTSSGGPGGVTYHETKTHRVGPGGVRYHAYLSSTLSHLIPGLFRLGSDGPNTPFHDHMANPLHMHLDTASITITYCYTTRAVAAPCGFIPLMWLA